MAHDASPPRWKTATSKDEYLSTPLPDPSTVDCRWCQERKALAHNEKTDDYSDVRMCQCDTPNGKQF